jgi:hypothetical protein
MIGASGAIGGLLGSYLVLFPGVRVRGVIPLGRVARTAEWPAWTVLGLWFVLQLINGALSLGFGTGATGGRGFLRACGWVRNRDCVRVGLLEGRSPTSGRGATRSAL